MLDLRLASGHALTVLVYIDHNTGGLVKDAFVVPKGLDAVVALMRAKPTIPTPVPIGVPREMRRRQMLEALQAAAVVGPDALDALDVVKPAGLQNRCPDEQRRHEQQERTAGQESEADLPSNVRAPAIQATGESLNPLCLPRLIGIDGEGARIERHGASVR